MSHVTSTRLHVKGLSVTFDSAVGRINVLTDVSLVLKRGETLAVIGESGSGKSVLGLSIMGLLPSNAKVEGEILFGDKNLLELDEDELRSIRGSKIAWTPQSVATSLNPTMKVGDQIAEALIEHLGYDKKRAWKEAIRILSDLGIPEAREKAKSYPHQLSGGMKQRVLLAISIAPRPEVLIMDEPTRGLDVLSKRALLKSIRKLRKIRKDLSLLIVTHDLEFAEQISDRVAVMYCGQVLEDSPTKVFFREPLHPYSKLLLQALPSRGMVPIPGKSECPDFDGCRFYNRCPFAQERCLVNPPLFRIGQSMVRCWLHSNEARPFRKRY